jgi:vacuolar-type H+-ATPase subunit I/STV1
MKHRKPWLICLIENIIEFIKINHLIKTKIRIMKRFELLTEAAQEKTSEASLKKVVANEIRAFKKQIADLEFEIEGKKQKVEERLGNVAVVGSAEVFTLFAEVTQLEQRKELLEKFVKEYYEG